MVIFYKKWKKYNEFQLTKNKMDFNTLKLKIIHPPPSEESHQRIVTGIEKQQSQNHRDKNFSVTFIE